MRGGIVVILWALAFATAAAGQDACLTGASDLGDHRALAALRTTMDATCPCASYSGPTGRRAFRRCARTVLRDAVDGAALRLECRANGRELFRHATCGTNRVACGRYDVDDFALGCRIAAPSGRNQCQSHGSRVENACTAETRCTDVVDWTAATCIDPRKQGPYGVGMRNVQFIKDSVVSPGTDRVLDTLIYYPTTPGGPLSGVMDAPLDNSGGPYPLLLFSHGSCGYPAQSGFLLPLIASYGLVVAAPPHPGNTIFDGFPGCSANLGASAQERPNDIIFVTDQLLAANGDPGSPFFGAIDPDRIGMSGHSFGGFTTYLVIDRDSRFRIALPMAPAVGAQVLTVPSMTMLGQIDSVVSVPAIRNAYALAAAPKFKVEIGHAGHYAFSDGCFPSSDCNFPTTLSQAEAHALVQRFAVPFVLRYLVGDLRFEPFLDNAVALAELESVR
jgi:predicted dienelactone hydrolase